MTNSQFKIQIENLPFLKGMQTMTNSQFKIPIENLPPMFPLAFKGYFNPSSDDDLTKINLNPEEGNMYISECTGSNNILGLGFIFNCCDKIVYTEGSWHVMITDAYRLGMLTNWKVNEYVFDTRNTPFIDCVSGGYCVNQIEREFEQLT